MKQHITASEWGEFERSNPKLAKKLKAYYSEWQNKYIEEHYPNQFITSQWEPIFVWFNIGQMFDFLLKNTEDGIDFGPIDRLSDIWYIGSKRSGSIELCDALWEACKEILNS